MKLTQAIDEVVNSSNKPLTPQEIKDIIKQRFPELYGTDKAKDNVARGNYSNLDHALLAPIYGYVKKSDKYSIDNSVKPYTISLIDNSEAADSLQDESLPDDLLQDLGVVYILSSGVFTAEGKRIIKIGFTTQELETRINQLYTTGSPFKFEEIKSYKVRNYVELEQSLHKLLAPYRLSNAREFFSEDAIEFIDQIVDIHLRVLNTSGQ
ncbi:GIY-YIG nuclease family protein [Undibacterium sp. Ji83W]|uniref:GIY-YIG nuclease family protein n=1 Tax=Undibacterium sp. Ji83W TaxID=3413043 RepID=UPI003BF05220